MPFLDIIFTVEILIDSYLGTSRRNTLLLLLTRPVGVAAALQISASPARTSLHLALW